MPPPHVERRIAPKLMDAMARQKKCTQGHVYAVRVPQSCVHSCFLHRNTHLEKLTLSNSNLVKVSWIVLQIGGRTT